MFYQSEIDDSLRFGDLVKGYLTNNLIIKEPILSYNIESHQYKIDIDMPQYSVILTPCCSIGESVISLSPLIKIKSLYLKNPFFSEELTRINRKMESQQALSPDDWETLPEVEKQIRLEEGLQYALLNIFIYDANPIFDEYTLKGKNIRNYMIDFKNIYKVKCDLIKRPEELHESPILDSKVLQLSIDARSQLRNKIAHYYSRAPIEDILLE